MKMTKKRVLAKAITWKVIGLAVLTALGYFLTGNISLAGESALVVAVISFILYIAHEWVWEHVKWGKEK